MRVYLHHQWGPGHFDLWEVEQQWQQCIIDITYANMSQQDKLFQVLGTATVSPWALRSTSQPHRQPHPALDHVTLKARARRLRNIYTTTGLPCAPGFELQTTPTLNSSQMLPNGTHHPLLDISALPDISQAEMDFPDTSFFRSSGSAGGQLPTPASIIHQYGDGGARVIKIEDLNIAVKIDHESHLRLEELQTMRAIRQIFPDGEIPVPEVHGWRRHGEQIFIYMSLIRGKTLREAWPALSEGDKASLHVELSQVVASLRRIAQTPDVICRSPSSESGFRNTNPCGRSVCERRRRTGSILQT